MIKAKELFDKLKSLETKKDTNIYLSYELKTFESLFLSKGFNVKVLDKQYSLNKIHLFLNKLYSSSNNVYITLDKSFLSFINREYSLIIFNNKYLKEYDLKGIFSLNFSLNQTLVLPLKNIYQ